MQGPIRRDFLKCLSGIPAILPAKDINDDSQLSTFVGVCYSCNDSFVVHRDGRVVLASCECKRLAVELYPDGVDVFKRDEESSEIFGIDNNQVFTFKNRDERRKVCVESPQDRVAGFTERLAAFKPNTVRSSRPKKNSASEWHELPPTEKEQPCQPT